MRLVATRPVLYLAHQYSAGDSLPVNDQPMIEAWLEAGSAAWKDEDDTPKTQPKAKPATAQAGMPGSSSTGDENDLIGRITETPEREKPAPKKRASK